MLLENTIIRLWLPTLGLLCLAWLASILRARIIYKRMMRQHGCKEIPSYPQKDPILGLDLLNVYKKAFEDKTFLDTNKRHFEVYGKTFRTTLLGKTIIKTSDPEVSKAFHATSFDKFGLEPLRLHIAPNFFGNGVILVDGRALIRSSFDVVHIANFERLQRHTSRFMNLLPKDETTVDLAPLLKLLNLDLSSEFIFGESIDSLSSEFQYQHLLDAFEYAQRGCGIRTVLGPLYIFHRDKKWYDACTVVTDFTEEHVDAALERLRSPHKLQPLHTGRLRLVDEMAKDTQDRYTLRSQLISVFSLAHDGMAQMLTNLFFHLARDPPLYQRLRQEIAPSAHLPLTYDLLRSYKLLHDCLRECHRLRTIATINQRQCVETTVLPLGGGLDGKAPLLVQKGDVVEVNYRAIHLDKDFWGADAETFNPDRWATARPTWQFTPFGGGPRTCPGLRLVYTEGAYVAAMVIREFASLECRDEVWEWQEEMRMTAMSRNGAKVGLIR